MNLYSGAEHAIHFKYATILNTVFVTFTFGLALPMLFPIAAFTFFNIYFLERLCVMYFHPSPPLYDDKLNAQMLSTLKWAPVMLIFFSYWYLGQPQLFANLAVARDYSFDPVITKHTAKPYMSPALPMFIASLMIMLVFLLAIFGITKRIRKCCSGACAKFGIQKEDGEFFIDENLGSYFSNIPAFDRKNMYVEEVRNRLNLHVKTYSDYSANQLRTADGTKNIKPMLSPYTYDLINCPDKIREFQFTPIKDRQTKAEDKLNDLIMLTLYTGFRLARKGKIEFDMGN